MQTTQRTPLFGVGRITAGWGLLVLASLALVAIGIYAYSQQIIYGEEVTGMRDWGPMGGAPWGLYISFVVYFIGVSFAGITVAALIRLTDLESLKPVARIAELLTVITILLGAMAIMADLGQPLRGLVNLFLYARPQSPFFGTFTLVVAGYLFASLVYLYLDGRADAASAAKARTKLAWFHNLWASGYRGTEAEKKRHRRAGFWLALAIVPLLVTAHSTLGFVFGLQGGRPGWYSALQAPGFVVLAGASGLGLLMVVAAAVSASPSFRGTIGKETFRVLGLFTMVLTIAYLYFMVVELLTSTYAGHHHEAALTWELLSGTYAPLFWTAVVMLLGTVIILMGQALSKRWSLPWLVLAGVMVNIAAVLKRYLIVVPSLTHGSLLPYGEGSYTPTWVEFAVVGGLFALGLFLFLVFMKVFPLMHVTSQDLPQAAGSKGPPRSPVPVHAMAASPPPGEGHEGRGAR